MIPLVLDWNQAWEAGPIRCGGKGFNLARLARYGLSVPAGGVLTSEVYTDLMAGSELSRLAAELSDTPPEETLDDSIKHRLKLLQTAIHAAGLPMLVRDEMARFLRRGGLDSTPVAVRPRV